MNANAKKRVEAIKIALKEVERIYGQITTKNLVEYSKDENSPTHKMFLWDIGKAAERYWEWQARQMISEVKIVIENDGKKVEIREYANIEIQAKEDNSGETTRVYENISVISKDEAMIRQLLAQLKKDVEIFVGKYNILKEASKIIEEMNAYISSVE